MTNANDNRTAVVLRLPTRPVRWVWGIPDRGDVSHMIKRLPDGSGGWVWHIACQPGRQIRRLEWRKDPEAWFWEDFGFSFSLACPTCLRLAGDSGDHAYYMAHLGDEP